MSPLSIVENGLEWIFNTIPVDIWIWGNVAVMAILWFAKEKITFALTVELMFVLLWGTCKFACFVLPLWLEWVVTVVVVITLIRLFRRGGA